MTQERIKEVIALHEDWLNNKIGGERADLSGANLSGANLGEADLRRANLGEADLRRADLRRADLRRADLSGADLRDTDLREADLSGADLSGADLRIAGLNGAFLTGADLSGADLSGVRLEGIKGDGKYIKSLQLEKYPIAYTPSVLQIGCKNYLISEWVEFDDKKIAQMDSGALEWWKKWKSTIMQTIERDPCEPTGS